MEGKNEGWEEVRVGRLVCLCETSYWHYAQKFFLTPLKDGGCIKSSKDIDFPEKRFETGQSGQVRLVPAVRPDQTRCGILVSAVKKARRNSEVRCPEKALTLRSLEDMGVGADRKGSFGKWEQGKQ